MSIKLKEVHLKGVSICGGIAIGKPVFFNLSHETIPHFKIAKSEIKKEIKRYQNAWAICFKDIEIIQTQLKEEGNSQGAEILSAHLEILKDPLFKEGIEELIQKKALNSEHLLEETIQDYETKFKKNADDFFLERLKDIRDITRRLINYLRKTVRMSLVDLPHGSIVFSKDLAPSDTAEAQAGQIKAFVTEVGGKTSHAAIIARAKGIPFITNIDFKSLDQSKCEQAIVDGKVGKIILNPLKTTLSKYELLQEQLRKNVKEIEKLRLCETETIDGYQIKLAANLESLDEVQQLKRYRGNGVGLFRSEYVFLSRLRRFPTEDEQVLVYKEFLNVLNGLPLVIRTFDIGGDKYNDYVQINEEANPFLGCRALRLMLRERHIFKQQLRAILKATPFGNIHLLFPLISCLSELLQAKEILEEAKAELKEEGVPVENSLKIGCMIEVPSAALASDSLAKHCDFFSIGTNDLVQYTLAVDRGNPTMSYLYNPLHVSVIRLIKMVVNEARRNEIPVTLCGEIAADPRFTPLLLGLGIHELSMAPRYIPVIRQAVRSISIVDACELANHALTLSTAEEIEDLLSNNFKRKSSSKLLKL